MAAGGVSRRGMLKAGAVGVIAGGAAPALGRPAYAVEAATDAVTPFRLRVPESALRDLKRRLAATRWPQREPVGDASQGLQLHRIRRLAEHWLTAYDWRRVEARLNRAGQFRTRLDGLGVHFLHVRSRHPDAMPLLLTHGWPGSVIEFLDTIGPLTNPTAHGGTAGDAFHLVIPSLPGFGFSDQPTDTGWNPARIARAWAELMDRLGYRRYLAQGGDWGSAVTNELGKLAPRGLAGVHLNMYFADPIVGQPPTAEEQVALAKLKAFFDTGSGYFSEQATRPQQMGYALSDSPVGQAAWIFEKFTEWVDGPAERVLGLDRILDDIMLYWLPATAASSARIYWEPGEQLKPGDVKVPVGYTTFPGEIVPIPEVWAERFYGDRLIYFDKTSVGGHFGAFEQPRIFAEQIRKFARRLR